MDIRMTGIDYNRAPVEVRERFAMTRGTAAVAMERLRADGGAQGCVILSTCNRTELWICGGKLLPYEALCDVCGVDPAEYRDCFLDRAGREAAEHLFALACGLKSQVFGEDQIITQVGDALALARGCGAAGPVLETLFRMAVTAAKRVKTDVRLTAADRSVAASTVAFLRGKLGTLDGLPCMVIGNGEMGRLAASALVAEGCDVLMTVRQYHHGEVCIPDGAQTIAYEKRLIYLPGMRVVVSATASPHYTLRAPDVAPFPTPAILCDLAVPRDIDPALADRPDLSLYDTDQICGHRPVRADYETLTQVREILQSCLAEFEAWYRFREFIPAVGEISACAADDLLGRMQKPIRRLPLAQDDRDAFAGYLNQSAQKAVARLLYGLRENLAPQLWKQCIEGLQKSAHGKEQV
ncbi:glutamyl-tRNA reductase [Anaerotruncus rubiinfantis]|uniref:glutamyl-tRNA reductase n=1 Tax=Anaerotruncus rubiinfantis TaxID=1720200 RepID=UPI001896ED69|nr:glutamyl-tRNA reductase [Anaerotruncus rubiinfantis]